MMETSLFHLQIIISKQLKIKPNKIKPQSDFAKELGVDSLDFIELGMSIEDKAASQIKTV